MGWQTSKLLAILLLTEIPEKNFRLSAKLLQTKTGQKNELERRVRGWGEETRERRT